MRSFLLLLVAVVAALSLSFGLNAARATEFVTVDGATLESGGVSGSAGATVTRHPGADAVLFAISGGERHDQACYIEFGWWQFTPTVQEQLTTSWWQPPCANEHHSFQGTQLANPPPSGIAFGITEIQVCTNLQRLKGVQITKMRLITAGTQGERPADVSGKFDRANCTESKWQPASHCVTGLELLCANAGPGGVAPPELPPYALDPASVHLTAISGFAGTSARVGAPVEKGYALYGLRSLEREDQACFLENTSNLLREPLVDEIPFDPHAFRTNSADRCGGGTPGDQVTADAEPTTAYLQEHQTDHYQTPVSGIRICMDNDSSRLKGIEVRGRSVGADVAGNFRVDDVPLNTDKALGKRTHCHDDRWQRWVECSASEVATAVVAHFEAGEPPRAVTGLALECARVRPLP